MNRGRHFFVVPRRMWRRVAFWPVSAVISLALCSGCDFLSDLFSPHESSHSFYEGRVVNQTDSTSLDGVRVELHGESVQSDSNGHFVFNDIATGPATLRLSKDDFFSLDTLVAVYLPVERTSETPVFYLRSVHTPPQIDTFFASPAITRSRDESVIFILNCHASNGNIERIVCDYGDGASDTLFPDTTTVSTSLRHVFLSPGQFDVHLRVFEEEDDSATASVEVEVSGNRRPEAFLEFPTHPFYANRYDWIGIVVNDSDGNFDNLSIDWGDGTPPETFFAQSDSKRYLHQYATVQTETRYFVVITVRDELQAQTIYVRTVVVTQLTGPLIENPITVLPHNVLPADSIVTAQVRVFQVEGYVKEILWQLNLHGGLSDLIARDTLDSISGSMGVGPKVFAHSFSTSLLRDTTNSINVRVTDSFGGSSNASATFFYWPNQ